MDTMVRAMRGGGSGHQDTTEQRKDADDAGVCKEGSTL